jgi:hypothetical protein
MLLDGHQLMAAAVNPSVFLAFISSFLCFSSSIFDLGGGSGAAIWSSGPIFAPI